MPIIEPITCAGCKSACLPNPASRCRRCRGLPPLGKDEPLEIPGSVAPTRPTAPQRPSAPAPLESAPPGVRQYAKGETVLSPPPPKTFEPLADDMFALLLVEGRARAISVARRYAKGEAEEAVQAGCARAWGRRAQFDGKNFEAWFGTVVRNEFFSSKRKRQPVALPETAPDPPASLEERPEEMSPVVARAIAELPAYLRETLRLWLSEEDSLAGIGEKLGGVPAGTIMSRLYRARETLRPILVEHARATGLLRRRFDSLPPLPSPPIPTPAPVAPAVLLRCKLPGCPVDFARGTPRQVYCSKRCVSRASRGVPWAPPEPKTFEGESRPTEKTCECGSVFAVLSTGRVPKLCAACKLRKRARRGRSEK